MGGASSQSFTLRKKMNKISKSLEKNTVIVLIATILTMTLTNSISNIIILLGVFTNLPSYTDAKFRNFLMAGLTFGILLQPNQILYFALTLLMVYCRGQDM